MDTLKMRFKLHNLEFEIEGKENVVKEEFENFKSFITGQLLPNINIAATQPKILDQGQGANKKGVAQIQEAIDIDITDFPVLREVVKKDLPKTESDWILIYAFYFSEFGEKNFTEQNIKDQYVATGRKNASRWKNIGNNIKTLLNKGYFKMHNDTEYMLKESGSSYAKQILQGNSISKSSPKSVTKSEVKKTEKTDSESKKNKSKGTSNIPFVDLNLPAMELNSLSEFFSTKNPRTQNEEVAVVMKWYKDHIKSNEITLEEVNYLLSITSKTPSALAQVLINMSGASFRWVTKATQGKYQLSSIGENYVMNKLPKISK